MSRQKSSAQEEIQSLQEQKPGYQVVLIISYTAEIRFVRGVFSHMYTIMTQRTLPLKKSILPEENEIPSGLQWQ